MKGKVYVLPYTVYLVYSLTSTLEWSDPSVWMSLLSAFMFVILFLVIEIFLAVEPVLPPFLLTQKIPVLIGGSNALVAVCNLSVTYFFPVWFQTVMLSSASTAGTYRRIVGQIGRCLSLMML
jgi:hypothetical protein